MDCESERYVRSVDASGLDLLIRVELCLYYNLPRGALAIPRGAWVDVPIGEFEREAEAILSEAERPREGAIAALRDPTPCSSSSWRCPSRTTAPPA